MTADDHISSKNAPTYTLHSETARSFHNCPARKLVIARNRFVTKHTSAPRDFDLHTAREALKADLIKSSANMVVRAGLNPMRYKIARTSHLVSREELSFLLEAYTHPRCFDIEDTCHDWVDDISPWVAGGSEGDAAWLAHIGARLDRFQVFWGDTPARGISIHTDPYQFIISLLRDLLSPAQALELAIAHLDIPWMLGHQTFKSLTGEVSRDEEESLDRLVLEIYERNKSHERASVSWWLGLLDVARPAALVLDVLERYVKEPSMIRRSDVFYTLLSMVERREDFMRLAFDTEGKIHIGPKLLYIHLARWGVEGIGEFLEKITPKLYGRWEAESWGGIFFLHGPEVTPYIYRCTKPSNKLRSRAVQWLRSEGANAIPETVEHYLDPTSSYQETAADILKHYVLTGNAHLIRRHLEDDPRGDTILEALEAAPVLETEQVAWMRAEEIPGWLEPWTRRGLKAPYPPTLPREQLPQLVSRETGRALPSSACVGFVRLLQECIKRPKPEIDLARAYFTEDSLERFGTALDLILAKAGNQRRYRWLASAQAILGARYLIDVLSLEVPPRSAPTGEHKYYHAPEIPAWVARAFALHPGNEGVRLLLQDWEWRHRYTRHWSWRYDPLDLAAKHRGVSYVGLIERYLPRLGMPLAGKCYFSLEGVDFAYDLDEELAPRLFERKDDVWKLVSIHHPGSAHVSARRLVGEEIERVLPIYRSLLDEALERKMTWGRFEWTQGIAHPIFAAFRKGIIWSARDADDQELLTARVCEDGTLANREDDHVALGNASRLIPVQWGEMSGRDKMVWSTIFAEHEIVAFGR